MSLLWPLQQRCYASLGMSAWHADRTPSYITSNPYFADSTARVLLATLLDIGRQPEPISIIELGAGSGRFSWLLHQKLTQLAADCPLPVPPWRLVMTDSSPPLLRAWKTQPQLKPLLRLGSLDIAKFDVSSPQRLQLQLRDVPLPPGPRIVLANYLWDSVPQDAYEVGGNQPAQALHVGLLTEADPSDMAPTVLMESLRLRPQRAPLPEDLSPALRALLQDYGQRLSQPTTVLMPVSAAACLASLAQDGPLVALSADKGIASPAHITDGETLPITLHGGTASLTVDFTALAAMVSAQGGWSRCGDSRESLFIHHLDVIGMSKADLSRGLLAFDQAFSNAASYDLYRLGRATVEEGIIPSADRLLAMLRLTQADPDVFWVFSEAIQHHVQEGLSPAEQATFRTLLPRLLQNTYQLPGDKDEVEAIIAAVAAELQDHQSAADAWEASLARSGPSVHALHGKAVSLSLLGRPQEALQAAQKALTLPLSHAKHAELSQWVLALQAWTKLS